MVVPYRNEEKNLPNLLEDLCRLQYPGQALEVVLVDDHSDDGSSQLAEKFGLQCGFKAWCCRRATRKKGGLRFGLGKVHG
ncbi:MAG: glycosyltransferase [Owenweeksia sp.]|nr:glycosyltransferase [Owenweeksia sp.]